MRKRRGCLKFKVANADSCAWLGLHPTGNIILQALSTSCHIIPSCLISVIFHCSHFLRLFALAERLMVEFHLAWSNCFVRAITTLSDKSVFTAGWSKGFLIENLSTPGIWWQRWWDCQLFGCMMPRPTHQEKCNLVHHPYKNLAIPCDPRGLHTFYVRGTDCILHNWTKVGQCSLLRFTPSPVHSIIYLKPCKVTVHYDILLSWCS